MVPKKTYGRIAYLGRSNTQLHRLLLSVSLSQVKIVTLSTRPLEKELMGKTTDPVACPLLHQRTFSAQVESILGSRIFG